MRALKGLVIGMGVLIVAGLAVVVVTIANRSFHGAAAPTDAVLALPQGAEVVETSLDGQRLALRLRLADGTSEIHVFDLATGGRTAVVRVRTDG